MLVLRNSRKDYTLGHLGGRVHKVLERHSYPTCSEPTDSIEYLKFKEGLWERPGEPVAEVIARITGVDDTMAEDVRAYLSDLHGFMAVKDGARESFKFKTF